MRDRTLWILSGITLALLIIGIAAIAAAGTTRMQSLALPVGMCREFFAFERIEGVWRTRDYQPSYSPHSRTYKADEQKWIHTPLPSDSILLVGTVTCGVDHAAGPWPFRHWVGQEVLRFEPIYEWPAALAPQELQQISPHVRTRLLAALGRTPAVTFLSPRAKFMVWSNVARDLGWLCIVLAFIGTILLAIRIRTFRCRRKRIDVGLCPNCGYALRGLDVPVCPECGGRFTFHERSLLARPAKQL